MEDELCGACPERHFEFDVQEWFCDCYNVQIETIDYEPDSGSAIERCNQCMDEGRP